MLQLTLATFVVAIYDAREYFMGTKISQTFVIGKTDVQCPRLARELEVDDVVVIVHSVNTFPSAKNGVSLSYNIYYAVLLFSPQ